MIKFIVITDFPILRIITDITPDPVQFIIVSYLCGHNMIFAI